MVEWYMKGDYLKNCNCSAPCSCDISGIPSPHKECEGMVGMRITEGEFDRVKLDGLRWVVLYHWPGPLHEGNGTVQAIIDEKATKDQRNALLQILSGQAGNAWFEFLASTVTTMIEPKFAPIHFDFDKENRTAKVKVDGVIETESAPLRLPNVKMKQKYVVRLPSGMEYKEFDLAFATVLKGTGKIKFNLQHTHSSLAKVEHTNRGLVA
ncbi:MAG: DUF1326 domain-containing protein [Nanoarchaeota archaeon]